MKMPLLSLGLTLVCVCTGKTGVSRRNFDSKKQILTLGEGGNMGFFVEHINALENSSLAFKFHTTINRKCAELFLVCDKTEKDAQYYVNYDGHNTFTILETNYDGYVIFHLINVNNGKTFQLMVNETDLNVSIKQEFGQLCQQHGITKENIFDMTKADRCLQAQD
uniref:Major urinary protein 4-like n=1 Tax=Nannospalax galili TaxID=1026970 RepID=A0A8C6RXR5_NANGA